MLGCVSMLFSRSASRAGVFTICCRQLPVEQLLLAFDLI